MLFMSLFHNRRITEDDSVASMFRSRIHSLLVIQGFHAPCAVPWNLQRGKTGQNVVGRFM